MIVAPDVAVLKRMEISSNGTSASDPRGDWGVRAAYSAVALGTIASLAMPMPVAARSKSDSSDIQICLADFDGPPPRGFFDEKHIYSCTYSSGSSELKNTGLVFKQNGGGVVIRQRRSEKLDGPSTSMRVLAAGHSLARHSRETYLSASTYTKPKLSAQIEDALYTHLDAHLFSKDDVIGAAALYSSQHVEALARLDHLANKKEGWKGSDSVAMTEYVKSFAKTFLETFFVAGQMIEPFIGLDSDGDVTLFWKNDNLIMDLSITSDGKYSFFADVSGDTHYEGDDIAVGLPLPEGVLTALKQRAV